MKLKRLTPILYVASIEESLDFWLQRLAFTKTMEVPEGDHLGFVALQRDGVEIMLQTYESLAKDLPSLKTDLDRAQTVLYLETESPSALRAAAQGADVVFPERTTFYGMHEIGLRTPGGHIVILSAKSAD